MNKNFIYSTAQGERRIDGSYPGHDGEGVHNNADTDYNVDTWYEMINI